MDIKKIIELIVFIVGVIIGVGGLNLDYLIRIKNRTILYRIEKKGIVYSDEGNVFQNILLTDGKKTNTTLNKINKTAYSCKISFINIGKVNIKTKKFRQHIIDMKKFLKNEKREYIKLKKKHKEMGKNYNKKEPLDYKTYINQFIYNHLDPSVSFTEHLNIRITNCSAVLDGIALDGKAKPVKFTIPSNFLNIERNTSVSNTQKVRLYFYRPFLQDCNKTENILTVYVLYCGTPDSKISVSSTIDNNDVMSFQCYYIIKIILSLFLLLPLVILFSVVILPIVVKTKLGQNLEQKLKQILQNTPADNIPDEDHFNANKKSDIRKLKNKKIKNRCRKNREKYKNGHLY